MKRDYRFYLLILAGGLLFGFGMAYSGMAKPEFVLSFLQLSNLGPLFVLLAAASVVGVILEIGSRIELTAPLTNKEFGKRDTTIDRKVVLGGSIFGVGLGLNGLCPGISYASLGLGNYPILVSIAGMFIGAYIQGILRSKKLL